MSKGNSLIFLVLLTAAILASRYFHLAGSVKTNNSHVQIRQEQISEVSITFKNKTLSFRKADDRWVGIQDGIVLQNVGAKFDSLITAASDLDKAVYKTDKPDSFERFGIDDLSAIAVEILADHKPVVLLFGSYDPLQDGTYFRYRGSDLVFFLPGNISGLLSINLTDYRYAVLPEIKLQNLTDLQFYWKGHLDFGYNFFQEQWCSQLLNFEIDRYSFEDYLYNINNLRSNILDRETIDHQKAINYGSIIMNYGGKGSPNVINFVEMGSPSKVFYLFDPVVKNNYLKLDSSAFFGKIWVNPTTFIKNK